MLQLPALQSSSPQLPAGAAAADTGATDSDGSFGQLLDSVTEGPLPEAIRDDLLQLVEDGVPLPEVLASLLERLQEETDLSLAPGMLPVLQAVVPEAALPDEQLLARLLGGRQNQGPQVGPTVAETENEPDMLAALDASDLPEEAEALLGKHKALLASRVTALETASQLNVSPQAAQQAGPLGGLLQGLRGPELAASLAANVGDSAQLEGPDALFLAPRVGEQNWGQVLSQRVLWMIGREQQSAELRLNPANLGPLEVKVSMHHDQASVSLLASTGAVREALEQALPRLRDMLGQQDIQLVQVDIGQRQDPRGEQTPAQAGGGGHAGDDGREGVGGDPVAGEGGDDPAAGARRIARGLVDAYA